MIPLHKKIDTSVSNNITVAAYILPCVDVKQYKHKRAPTLTPPSWLPGGAAPLVHISKLQKTCRQNQRKYEEDESVCIDMCI